MHYHTIVVDITFFLIIKLLDPTKFEGESYVKNVFKPPVIKRPVPYDDGHELCLTNRQSAVPIFYRNIPFTLGT